MDKHAADGHRAARSHGKKPANNVDHKPIRLMLAAGPPTNKITHNPSVSNKLYIVCLIESRSGVTRRRA